MIDKHKDKRKYNYFGYLSTKFWLKGNDTGVTRLQFILPVLLFNWESQTGHRSSLMQENNLSLILQEV